MDEAVREHVFDLFFSTKSEGTGLGLSTAQSVVRDHGGEIDIEWPVSLHRAVEANFDAHHAAMECLGEMLWESQRSGRPPDGNAYIAAVQRRATRD